MLVARGRDLGRAAAAFASEVGVRNVAPFGAGLHLRVDPARWSEEAVARALNGAGATDVVVEPAEPSLEDVFLEVVGRSAGQP